jgi:acetolactate synthase-1/2/3 large subunit
MTGTTIEKWTGLNGLLPTGSRLLASCFDAHHTIGGGLFAVGDVVEDVDRVSSSGMTFEDGLLFRCLWSGEGSPAELVIYDTSGVRRYHRLDGVSTPHDILVVDGKILVVATTQNEVQVVAPDGDVVSRWRAPGETDSWHLNSLARYGDRIVVCGFGPFLRRRGWDESGKPATGRVVDMNTGEPLLDGLRAPHNPWYGDGTWLVCDSAAGEVVEIRDATRQVARRLTMPGWPRGLVVTDDHLFVGLSPHRYVSASVDSAAVAVVDRANWTVRGLVELPAREVYALALVPASLAEGIRRGFGTNSTRVHEQAQRHLFERLGRQPRRLWAISDPLAEEDCRVAIAVVADPPEEVEVGSLLTVECTVRNTGAGMLTPAPPQPVRMVHRWYDESGSVVHTQAIRGALPRSLPPEAVAQVPVRCRVPSDSGSYRLRITLAQDGGVPFDELDSGSAVEVPVRAVPHRVDYERLAEFGLYPSDIQEAYTAGGTVEDLVRALLARPTGGYRGLTVGLIEDLGLDMFVAAVADTLRCSPPAIRHLVQDALPAPDQVLLTGAEAVALALRRSGTEVAFAYAGTSELALCDALSRLGLLVNGRGDRESVFQAGGASRLRPGNGAAVLHGARGLTNALGALGDLRRNEAGVLAVVGLPSTGSAPFLPPHGEPDLIPLCGGFARSWYEAGAVPADDDERVATATAFAAELGRSLREVRQAPYGPVLFGVPQDVAEQDWVPLPALAALTGSDQPADEEDQLAAAATVISAARRPAVLIDDYALIHPGLRAALAEFCARTGAPVLQVKYRRGPMLFERLSEEEVPGFLGWYDPADSAHRALLEASDLLVTVEDRNMYPRVVGDLPAGRKVALTTSPDAVLKNGYLGPNDLLVAGDVVAGLARLASTVEDRSGTEPWYAGMETRSLEGPLVPEAARVIRAGVARAIGEVATRLGRQVLLVDDSQMFGGMLAEEYDEFPVGMRVFGGHGGFVGSGIAIATGLALGEPASKVLCCLGDQGFTNSVQGLVAAVQESAPVTFLVCNNGGSVSLRKQSRPSGWLDGGSDTYLDNAAGMRYVDVATALGLQSRRVDLSCWLDRDQSSMQLDTFGRTLEAAAEHPGPALIELVLPSDPEFWSGVWITAGFEQSSRPAPVATGADGA